MDKHLFKFRMMAVYIMVLAWSLSGPILKTYFNLLPSAFFGIIGIWVMMVGLTQKWLRKNFSVEQLLLFVIITDIVFIVGTGILNYQKDIKDMLIFHMIIDGPYHALMIASAGKLESYYLSKFSSKVQDGIRATIMNNKTYAAIIGLIIGSLLPFVMNVYGIVWVDLVMMIIGVWLEMKALRLI